MYDRDRDASVRFIWNQIRIPQIEAAISQVKNAVCAWHGVAASVIRNLQNSELVHNVSQAEVHS